MQTTAFHMFTNLFSSSFAHTSTQLVHITQPTASRHAPIHSPGPCVCVRSGETRLHGIQRTRIGVCAPPCDCVLLQCFASHTTNQLIENSRSVQTGISQRAFRRTEETNSIFSFQPNCVRLTVTQTKLQRNSTSSGLRKLNIRATQ